MKTLIQLVLIVLTNTAFGQSAYPDLHREIMKKDSLIFEETFNKCNFDSIGSILSEDLEFYHDQHGAAYGKDTFIAMLKNNICGLPYRPRRENDKVYNTVFPLKQGTELYGAIQTGKHRFYANEAGVEEYFTSIADFTHLWILENNQWKLKRILSYNHKIKDEKTPE